MEWRLKEILRVLRESNKIRRLACRAVQGNIREIKNTFLNECLNEVLKM